MILEVTAQCIGCGCTDNRACEVDVDGNGCHWLRVDYSAGIGVCSECPEHEARFDAGDRTMSADIPLDEKGELPVEFDDEPESLLLPGDLEYHETLSYLRDRMPPR